MTSHDKRRLNLALWYAQEAIASASIGLHEQAADELETCKEYLTVLLGRPVHIASPDEAVHMLCMLEDGTFLVAS